MAAQKNPQELPKREQGVFKTVMKCYEQKQYKKGLKSAEQILKKHPKHGETLAMKGLILNCLKRKEEAVQFAKKGLFSNLKSHVCWHVYGLIHRSERRYADAIKSYQNALKYDKDNLLILKDLSLLQVQRGLYDGFQESRRQILLLKSDQKINWIGYAVGNHMAKDYQKCLHILDTFIKTLDKDKVWDYQDSEMFLYRNQILEESGDLMGALKDLDEIENDARDKQHIWFRRATIQAGMGDLASAEAGFRKLLEVNNENHAYHKGLQQAMGLVPDSEGKYTEMQIKTLSELYDGFKAKWKYCTYAKRFPLTFTHGDDFKARVDAYMRPKLRKGVPSLFRDLKALYGDKFKVSVIEEFVKAYYANLKSKRRFSEKDEPDSETPNVFVWVLYYLASHYEFLGQYEEALKLLDEGIAHTPTAIDLYVLKARAYKHLRDYQTAYEILNFARELDLADRYLNTKCVRYAFRAGKVQDAERIVKLFLRETDTLDSLFEMQAMWYEVSAGLCHFKQGNFGQALTKFYSVEKHFEDISEDQFDFHTWCLRKSTLRAYVDMLKYQEVLRGHRFFKKAANNIIKVYTTIFDKPQKTADGSGEDGDVDMEKLTPKERRALKKRQKRLAAKAKKKQEAEEAKKKAAKDAEDAQKGTASAQSEAAKASTLKESIPDGKKYAESPDPLGQATKMVKELQLYAAKDIDTHIAAFEVYIRKKRCLLSLQALKKALKIYATTPPRDKKYKHIPTHTTTSSNKTPNPTLHCHIVLLSKTLREEKELDPLVVKICALETKAISEFPVGSKSLTEFNDEFLKANSSSLKHRVAAARCRKLLGADDDKAAAAIVDDKLADVAADLDSCVEAYEFLKGLKLPDKAESLRSIFHKKYPITPDFKPPASKKDS
eukprot:CAMPEP_0184490590 /NCGR_PEP_ID=MMETSP0113_2-20130426/18271_1 /TAXON_ID=91329 /ORGANISM="Norrisiella sphaerica, Strain BC52" /LENGTH=888 /DNA_ID=CAMNT_0026874535 /DNA_START=83 /DNA_END=2749 /DNA_ORIENTATION=+